MGSPWMPEASVSEGQCQCLLLHYALIAGRSSLDVGSGVYNFFFHMERRRRAMRLLSLVSCRRIDSKYLVPPHSDTYVTLIETKKPVTLTRT